MGVDKLSISQTSDRLNPESILICNLALRECKRELKNTPKSIMEHMIVHHGWHKIPQHVREEMDKRKPHPKTKQVMTEESYLKFIDNNPNEWWLDNEFIWTDIRNLHFLHKNSKGTRSLRSYYHE